MLKALYYRPADLAKFPTSQELSSWREVLRLVRQSSRMPPLGAGRNPIALAVAPPRSSAPTALMLTARMPGEGRRPRTNDGGHPRGGAHPWGRDPGSRCRCGSTLPSGCRPCTRRRSLAAAPAGATRVQLAHIDGVSSPRVRDAAGQHGCGPLTPVRHFDPGRSIWAALQHGVPTLPPMRPRSTANQREPRATRRD